MGNVNSGRSDAAVNLLDFRTHGNALLCVEVGERLVHKEDINLSYKRTAYRNTLLLTAGELTGEPFEIVGKTENLCGCLNLFLDYVGVDTLEHEAESKVFIHSKMRIERVRLEYHRYASLLGGHLIGKLAVYVELTGGDFLKAGNHTKSCRLTATG